jgi:FG-GAP repeat protein
MSIASCGGPHGDQDGGADAAVDAEVDADVGTGFLVRVTAIGVRQPIALEMISADKRERVLVTEDGPLTFRHRVPDGMSATFTAVGTQACVAPAPTTITGTDAQIQLVCDGVVDLQLLAFDPPVRLAAAAADGPFDPLVRQYRGSFPFLLEPADAVQLVGTAYYPADAKVDVTIGGVTNSAASGQPFPISFATPISNIDISLAYPSTGTPVFQVPYHLINNVQTLAQEAFVKPSTTSANATFSRVAIDGDVLLVGAPDDGGSGAAYVFRRAGSGWIEEASLKAPAPVAGDKFGIAVAVSGDTVAIGAPFDDANAANSGAVYVFRKGATWNLEAILKAPAPAAEDHLGTAVALEGDTLAAGAPLHDGGQMDSGAVFVYARSGTTWAAPATLKQQTIAAASSFGTSVALSGTTLVTGAPTESNGRGFAYVFVQSGGTWTQQARLQKAGGTSFENFGLAVDVSANTIVVGVPGEDGGGRIDQGGAYVFDRSGTTWNTGTPIAAPVPGDDDQFGMTVAIDRNHIVVGAKFEDGSAKGIGQTPDATLTHAGAAYFYRRTGTTSFTPLYIKASNTAFDNQFGTSVAVDRTTFVVGAPNENTGAAHAGAVYVFR